MGSLGRVLERLGLILERLGGVLERLGRVLKRLGAENSVLGQKIASWARFDVNYVKRGTRGPALLGPGYPPIIKTKKDLL